MDEKVVYDRELLLHGARRNRVLELWEVQRYGQDSYADADYVCVYGRTPAQWYEAGARLLGRTAVECTRDALADAIGRDIAAFLRTAGPQRRVCVVDLFAGSGNTLYWLARHLPADRAIGFELDAAVFALTRQNIAALDLPIELDHVDFEVGLSTLVVPAGEPVVVFVAPPWGRALSDIDGLDLRRTSPPVPAIVNRVLDRFRSHPLVCAVQVFERNEPTSLVALEDRFDRTSLHVYGFNQPGANHGVLLGEVGALG